MGLGVVLGILGGVLGVYLLALAYDQGKNVSNPSLRYHRIKIKIRTPAMDDNAGWFESFFCWDTYQTEMRSPNRIPDSIVDTMYADLADASLRLHRNDQ